MLDFASKSQNISKMLDHRYDLYNSVNTKISYEEEKLLLEQNYPVIYVFIHSFILGCLSIAAIVFQILVIMNYPTPLTNGSGILYGTYFLIAITLALIVG